MLRYRKCLLTILAIVVAAMLFTLQAQQIATPKQIDPIAHLLELAAPLPESAYDYEDPWERENPPPIPDENSPIELLVKYWSRQSRVAELKMPNDRIRQRLLDAAEQDSELLPKLIWLMPDTPEATDRIKAILDARPKLNVEWGVMSEIRGLRREDMDEFGWQLPVRNWLIKRSQHFRDELFEQASKMQQTTVNTITSSGVVTVVFEGALESLAQLDWEKAKPLLDKHAASGSPNQVAKSLGLQFKHAVETGDASQQSALLERLLQIANNREAAEPARREAYQALLKTDWLGRDQFYLSLFSDDALTEIKDSGLSYQLNALLNENPDKWIPAIAQLIGNPNRKTHDAAVGALMRFNWQRPRKEAMLPLLPWLIDPNWASTKLKPIREGLVQHLRQVRIPEAVPFLIATLRSDDRSLRLAVARTLAEYDAPQAGAELRIAGLAEAPGRALAFAEALVKCGALSDAEKIAYVELYASKITRVEDVKLMQDGTGLYYSFSGGDDSFDWEIGLQLSLERNAPVQLASALIERAKTLQPTNPTLANNLLLIVQRWPVLAAFQNIAERIGDGTADHRAIGQALRHREKFRDSAGLELQALTKRGGRAAGIAAALLGDQSVEKEILRGADREAQTALLACARLLREPLPVETVGALYAVKENALLRKAVGLYLESEDSPEARKLILAQHPNEALILGARRSFDPKPTTWEEKLREEVKRPNGSEKIFALTSGKTRNLSIRARRGKAIIIKSKDDSREEFRELTSDEFAEIRELFDATDFDNLPPLIQVPASNTFPGGANNNVSFASRATIESFQFVHLMASGGRRVFAELILPFKKEANAYQKLYALFSRLEKSDGFRLRYKLADKIEGLEVLLADENKHVKTVCQQGAQTRVLIGKRSEDEGSRWFTVSPNGLGSEAEEPTACQILGSLNELGKQIGGSFDTKREAWRVRASGETIQSGYLAGDPNYSAGLWKVRPGKAPVRISEVSLSWLLVAGGRWVVGSQTGENHQQVLRRLDLRSNRLLSTTVPPADYVQPIAEIPATGKVVIACYEDHYLQPTKTNFYLLDPATGAAQPIKGEFRPLEQQTFRQLQPVAGSTNFWAAIPDEKLNKTLIGVYDAQRFEFKPLADLPEIRFNSLQMWVDESAGKTFIAYNGHLLSLPMTRR